MSAEPACVTHEGPLFGVFEADVLLQGRLLHCCVITLTALVLHLFLGRMFSEDVSPEEVWSHASEVTLGASLSLLQVFAVRSLLVFRGQVLDQIAMLPSSRSGHWLNFRGFRFLSCSKIL